MSRLTEYLPQLTGVVFADEDDDNEFQKALQAVLQRGGGNTGGTKPAAGGTTGATTGKTYYEQLREQNQGLSGFKTMDQLRADPGARFVNDNTIVTANGSRYTLEAGTDLWKAAGGTYGSAADRAAYQAGRPVGAGGGGAGATTTQTPGVLPGVRDATLSPEARQFGPVDFASLTNERGVSIPGWDAYRQPGIGIPNAGDRQQITDRTGLNTMQAGRQGSATQFPVAPGFRGAGQVGNNINFGGTGAVGGNSQLASTLEPQMQFAPATASVPGTYVQGQGNVNDSNRAYAVPFNIGPGGAALANIAGANVQVNGPPGSGVGYGFALNAPPESNPFALTGRNPSEDPALQAIQTLQLNSALAQGRIGDLMATNPNQFGGNRAGSANPLFSGNGGMGQGSFWSGYTPDPLGATPPAATGAAAGGTQLPADYQSSASRLFSGGGYMGGYGGATAPTPTTPTSSAADLFSRGGAGYMGGQGAGPPSAAAGMFGPGGGGYMGGSPLLGNVQQSLQAAPAPAAGAAAPTLLAQLQAQREEEERGGAYGGNPGGIDRVGYSRGGTVYAGLPGFASGGKVNTNVMDGAFFGNPTPAVPPIDSALGGSLDSSSGEGTASSTPGGAVQTTPTDSVNPADSAIQPVQAPQNTTAIVPTTPQAQAPAVAPPVQAPPVQTTPPVAMPPAQPPAQTPVPNWNYQPQSGLDLGVLNQFNAAVARQAQQARLRETYSNRWQAANLAAPTAIQLQPGQQMPTEGLPPGAYYDTSEALKSLMGDIKSSQVELAGLGQVADPEQIMAYLSGLEVEQAPYQKAQDIKLQLAGLGQAGQGDTGALMQQQEALKQQMGPLATILDAQQKRTQLGSRMDTQSLFSQVDALQDAIAGIQAFNKTVGELQPKALKGDPEAQRMMAVLAAQQMPDQNVVEGQLFAAKQQLQQAESQNNAIDEAERSIANLVAATGLPPQEVSNQLGIYGAQMDQLKQAYNAAMQGESYRNQMASLIGGKDPTAELGRLGALIGTAKTNYGNVEKARQLNNRIQNLAQRGAQLPGFAKGGNWIAGATSNSHGQFRAKAKAAGMSTKAYASKMASAPGRTGKQARLAKTLMSFAGGGGMTTEEPIIGYGMFSGRPRFQVGEPQYPGGPPMAERLQITPLNRPAALPMGRMSRAA